MNNKNSWHILIFATQGYTCKTMSKGVCDGINTKPIFVVKDYIAAQSLQNHL